MASASFKQLIYCNDESNNNYPLTLKASELITGTAFSQYLPAFQIGIQAPPGTKFYLNNNNTPVIIGYTGLFDLDLSNLGSISALKFDTSSINRIRANDSNILIIDMIYLGGT